MRINVHIERLVLDGLPVDQRSSPQIQAAVQAQLAELLVAGGVSESLQNLGAVQSIRAPRISIHENELPTAIGSSIANAIHGGLEQ
ncbi:MAG: hypothetical protein U0930_23300 [Pirellulales bacterium]